MTKKKKILTALLVCVIAALIAGSMWLMNYMPEYREATQEEIEKFSVYKVDFTKLEGAAGKTELEILLSMCTQVDPETLEPIGDRETTATEDPNKYYTSETMAQYLVEYKSDLTITFSEGVLSVGYLQRDGLTVVLGYDKDGLYALGVYNKAENYAYFEHAGKASIATNINSSFGG